MGDIQNQPSTVLVMCLHPVIKAHLLPPALVQEGTCSQAPFVPPGSRGRARGRRETKQKGNHSKPTSLALQKPSAIICRMRITNLAQFSSHMLQDLVSLQLFYFKHPHDTKEFAIFFLLAKIHNHQQFQFSYLIFFFFNSSVPGLLSLAGLYRGKERGRAGKAAAAHGIP